MTQGGSNARMIIALLMMLASISVAHAEEPAVGAHAFMAPYRTQCSDRIYASCVDQRKILSAGLAEAKAEGKRALIVFGFNSCPPCNVLDFWLKSPEGAALTQSYVQIELSIFDKTGALRPEIYSDVLPRLGLSINQTPPYGVPLFAIVDPVAAKVIGQPILGFGARHHEQHAAYLTAYANSEKPK